MGGRKDLITAGLTLGALSGAAEKAKGKMSAIIATESGAVVSFTAADAAPVADLTAAIVPVQSGSGDPSPTNIRPISGWTECKVTRTGKNLIDDTIRYLYNVKSLFIGGGNGYEVKLPPGRYTVSINIASNSYTVYYREKNDSSQTRIWTNTGTASKQIDLSGGMYNFWIYSNAGIIQSDIVSFQIELGSVATAYEPYRGDTHSVSFGSAGTVYGGTLDVTTGTLTVDKANIASYAGETLPGAWISDRDVYAEGTTPTIGAQVVYELATPIIYHLTPIEIQTLTGQNTIWADTGDVTVKYTADTKAFIDKYIAERRNG